MREEAVFDGDPKRLLWTTLGFLGATALLFGYLLLAGRLSAHTLYMPAVILGMGGCSLLAGLMRLFPVLDWLLLPVLVLAAATSLATPLAVDFYRMTGIVLADSVGGYVLLASAGVLLFRAAWQGFFTQMTGAYF